MRESLLPLSAGRRASSGRSPASQLDIGPTPKLRQTVTGSRAPFYSRPLIYICCRKRPDVSEASKKSFSQAVSPEPRSPSPLHLLVSMSNIERRGQKDTYLVEIDEFFTLRRARPLTLLFFLTPGGPVSPASVWSGFCTRLRRTSDYTRLVSEMSTLDFRVD